MFRCSCGTPISIARFCRGCGKKRNLAKPLLLALGLIGVLVAVIYGVSRPKATNEQMADTVSSHQLTASGDPKKDMANVDALLKEGSQTSCLEAVTLLDHLLAQYPDFGYGLRLKAHLLRDLHRDKEAMASYQAFLAKHPDDQRTRMALADVLLRGPQPQAGIALLEDILVKCPNYAEVHERLATAYTRLKDSERANAHRAASAMLTRQNTNQKPPFVYLPRIPGSEPVPGP